METPIIITVKWRDECKLVSVTQGFTFSDFVGVIKGKWIALENTPFSCICSIGDVTGCCLDSDYDLTNVLILCQISGVKLVSVCLKTYGFFDVGSGSEGCNGGNSRRGSGGSNTNDSGGQIGGGKGVVGGPGVKCRVGSGGSFTNDSCPQRFSCSSGDDTVRSQKKRKIPSLGKNVELDGKSVHGGEDLGQEVEFGGSNNIPQYDVCPTLKKKPLLSDDWAHIMDHGVGLEFTGGAVEFRSELIEYTTRMGFNFKYVRNDSRYIHVVCKEDAIDGCDWFIKAKCQRVTRYFQIYKTNMEHKCVGKLVNDSSRRLGSKLMGCLVLQKVKARPTIAPREIVEILKDSYGVDISYSRAWRTVEAARSMIFGIYDESYDQLRWYCRAILRTNPGSVVSLEQNNETNHFERVFIGFKACIDGFHSCRPLLFLDGTFMKGRAKGTLLSATAKDGNNGLFPVAFAIVSAENKANLIWFLEKLRDFVKHEKTVLYISDRNSGLMKAFKIVFTEPVHFYCLYHLLTNLKGKFSTGWTAQNRADLGVLFKECAYAPNVRIFEEKLALFKSVGGSIADKWLEDLPFDKWSVAYSPNICRYGEMTSNAAESFNSWIRESRALPITYMIDSIMYKINNWYVKRRLDSSSWTGALCKTKELLWNKLTELGRSWVISACADGKYHVASNPTAIVDLQSRACTCYQWQVRGFPCAHAVAVIRKVCKTIYNQVEDCFLADNYRACYKNDIHSIPETERFECQGSNDESNILPPTLNHPPGRPKNGARINSYGEFRQKKPQPLKTCQRCGNLASHDETTCRLKHPDDYYPDLEMHTAP